MMEHTPTHKDTKTQHEDTQLDELQWINKGLSTLDTLPTSARTAKRLLVHHNQIRVLTHLDLFPALEELIIGIEQCITADIDISDGRS